MSAAGTPSTDPWIILARERARYEDQFKSLKPNNGIITGEQAKGYLLQSQLPPAVLGQIWTLADTDSDGKMNINEFSIACKLINLKLRGFEIPKLLPPSLLASLKLYSTTATPPAIPPLPNPALLNNVAISRPEPPKIVPMTTLPPKSAFGPSATLPTHPMLNNMQNVSSSTILPGLGNVSSSTGIIQPSVNLMGSSTAPIIPTGIVPPMQTSVPGQPLVGFGAPQPINTNLPPLGTSAINAASLISSGAISPVGASTVIPTAIIGGSSVINTPRASVTSLERAASIDSAGGVEWSVPHQTKLKYTQMFNTMDRTRTGFLSGAQARNVMVQSKLSQATLAQIWGLSDMDSDGRLGCEEFVLAMHLCEAALAGTPPPSKLAPDLVPPSFRRTTRTASISSQGSAVQLEQDSTSMLLQTSFEDKRKENYEKGQAELERRRKTLLDQQRKEAEERERKEREELERREKARQEAERKRLEELEKMMRDQQEKERLVEEERKRQAEQREAARKEMERQRQLEWEKQRLQELQQQRQREQETVLKLKAKNQSLTIELTSLNDQVKELSQKICDTRIGVSNVKSTIDGMRSTRDTQMQEMSQLKTKLKDQNAKLLALSQEKVKLDARNKINTQDSDQTKLSFENKDITINNLRQKIEDIQLQIDSKLMDIENNNSLLTDLKGQMKNLIAECETLYASYEDKRTQVLEMKNANKSSVANNYGDAWKGTNDAWGTEESAASEWPVENTWNDNNNDNNSVPADLDNIPGVHKYRAIYEFSARNNDEISFQPGDIVHVPEQQTGEPGWLAGEIRGKTGWFPESYVEPVDGVGISGTSSVPKEETVAEPVIVESTKFTEITEIPEAVAVTLPSSSTPQLEEEEEEEVAAEPEYYVASFAYQSQEPGDLTFNAGDVIAVCKKDGDWWTGKLNGLVGIFPCNYVQKVDNSSNTSTAIISGISPAAVSSALEDISNVVNNSQIDNEVSQINEKSTEKPFDTSMLANAQIIKGKKPEIASVIAPYQATSPEQLSLARGQLIMIRKKTDSGWWEGELQAKGRKRQVGWFPASYVKILNSSGKISGRSTPVSTTRMQQEVVIDKVIAMYSYTANNPDELSFLKDDIINVIAREEEAWWRGELNGVSGLFPSNYVGPLQQTQWVGNKRRQGAINELIQSERVYVQDIALIYEVFELPLIKSNILSTKEVNEIFINYQDILECNKKFLEHLNRSLDRQSNTIGDVICEHLPKMIAYRTFCRKQLHSAAFLQELINSHKNLKYLLKKCQNNYLTKGMPLSSFLIKPMQRITKYPLLIKKILENTPHNHPDYKFLEEAARKSESFVSQVNEDIRMKENLEGMEWIQECVQNELNLVFNSSTNKLGQRKLIHYSNFTKLKTGKELIGFLFNDFLMLVQPSKSIAGQFTFQRNQNISYKMYKMPILIQNLQVSRESSDSVENGTDSNRVLKIQDEKSGYKILLLAFTVHECRTWMKEIQNCKETFKEFTRWNIQNKRKTQLHLGPSCGRLLVLVQKGKRFILNGKLHTENIYCKVTLGNQEQETDFAKDNLNNGNFQPANNNGALPQIPTLIWNYSMQFQLRNLNEENLTFTIFQHNPFSLDEFLGKAELKIQDIYLETQNINGPIVKKLILHQVESGEITVKLDLHMFSNY